MNFASDGCNARGDESIEDSNERRRLFKKVLYPDRNDEKINKNPIDTKPGRPYKPIFKANNCLLSVLNTDLDGNYN